MDPAFYIVGVSRQMLCIQCLTEDGTDWEWQSFNPPTETPESLARSGSQPRGFDTPQAAWDEITQQQRDGSDWLMTILCPISEACQQATDPWENLAVPFVQPFQGKVALEAAHARLTPPKVAASAVFDQDAADSESSAATPSPSPAALHLANTLSKCALRLLAATRHLPMGQRLARNTIAYKLGENTLLTAEDLLEAATVVWQQKHDKPHPPQGCLQIAEDAAQPTLEPSAPANPIGSTPPPPTPSSLHVSSCAESGH